MTVYLCIDHYTKVIFLATYEKIHFQWFRQNLLGGALRSR